MARTNAWVACTLGGGVVVRHLVGTEGGGLGGGLVSRRGAWRIGGFTGGTLDGKVVGEALGLQLLVITVSTSSSLLVRMQNELLLSVWC
jgi:hypothetical protein